MPKRNFCIKRRRQICNGWLELFGILQSLVFRPMTVLTGSQEDVLIHSPYSTKQRRSLEA